MKCTDYVKGAKTEDRLRSVALGSPSQPEDTVLGCQWRARWWIWGQGGDNGFRPHKVHPSRPLGPHPLSESRSVGSHH